MARCRWFVATLAVVCGALLLTAGSRPVRAAAATSSASSGVITVLADGEARGEPDSAVFRVGADGNGGTPRAALRDANAQMQTILDTLHGSGIAEADIQTAGLSLYPIYAEAGARADTPPAISGYRANNSVVVRVRDLSQVNPLLDALTEAGISDLSGLEFGIQDTATLHARALADAVQRARPLAAAAAQAAGLTLGPIEEIAEVNANPPTAYAAGIGGAGGPGSNVQSGTLSVQVRVQVSFQVAGQ